MRTLTAALLLAICTTVSAATEGSEIEPMREVFVDRTAARLLARLDAPVRSRSVEPHLRHEADLVALMRPVVLRGVPLGKIVVDGAASVRLHVTGATPGTVLLVAGEEDGTFERFEPGESATWTPTTRGEVVYIAVERGGENISISELAAGTPEPNGAASPCTKDVACSKASDDPEVAEAGRAIALIRFVRGKSSYVCSGGLVSDTNGSGTPYFLTARHCISTQEEAASIEAVWDYRVTACGVASSATENTRTYGGELLVASADTDVALLKLNKLPANRVFLGVELSPLAAGTRTHRVSHAEGTPQKYSTGTVRTSGAGCAAAPRPRYIYTTPTEGAVAQGSSGAPLLVFGLRIAGQLFALCGPSPSDPCAVYNETLDGSIAASWPLLAPYLDPPPAAVRRRSARH